MKEISCRIVVDFRKISMQLKYWPYQLMEIDRIFLKLHGAKLFSTSALDLATAKSQWPRKVGNAPHL